MRACRTLLGLLLLVPVALGAEVVPLEGQPIKGDIVKLTEKEVVYQVEGKKATKAIKDILRLEFRDASKPRDKYSRVELTDGSVLLVKSYLWKKKSIELTLVSGPKFTLEVGHIANILNTAHNDAHQRDWRVRLGKLRGKNVVVRLDKGGKDRASSFEATFGEGDETGTKITYVISDDIDGTTVTATSTITDLRGFIFKHVLPPRAPATSLKLFDSAGNTVMVSSLTPSDKGVSVTTPAGVKIDYTYEQIATLDYAKGRFEFLTEMDEGKKSVKASSNLASSDEPEVRHYVEGPVTIGGTTMKRGQTLFPRVELTVELDGAFQQFRAMVGENTRQGELDGKVPKMTVPTTMVIEGDGRELATVTFSPKDMVRHKELLLNVKDVQKLKIIVKVKGLDTGSHLALGEARIIK